MATLKWRAPFALVVLLLALVNLPFIAKTEDFASPVEQEASDTPPAEESSASSDSEAAIPENSSTAQGILNKLKEFPGLGEYGAGLLQLAEEGLGISASKLELSKIVPMLVELQKNVHDHYLVTRGKSKYFPSSLLQRVVSRKSQSRVIKSMRQFAPNTDDAELMQQLDVVTHVLHELHSNPQNNIKDILHTVSAAVGLRLEDEDMKELHTHMQWAQELLQKIAPLIPSALTGQKAEEL